MPTSSSAEIAQDLNLHLSDSYTFPATLPPVFPDTVSFLISFLQPKAELISEFISCRVNSAVCSMTVCQVVPRKDGPSEAILSKHCSESEFEPSRVSEQKPGSATERWKVLKTLVLQPQSR